MTDGSGRKCTCESARKRKTKDENGVTMASHEATATVNGEVSKQHGRARNNVKG